MFWIFRRTGAANFFNSLNNNCSTSKGAGNNTQDKYVKRPPRKSYGRLHAESDDTASMKHKIDGAFDNLESLEIITPRETNENYNNQLTQSELIKHKTDHLSSGDDSVCSVTDCGGNFIPNDLCELNMTGLCNNLKTNLLSQQQKQQQQQQQQKEVNQNIINRLHTLAASDDDDFDESLTCNVCDRAFHCQRQLASHQQKKRHFGCSGCDSLFPSLMLLEHHKEEFEHWSDSEMSGRLCCRRNRADDYFTDTDSFSSEAESEDLERLL